MAPKYFTFPYKPVIEVNHDNNPDILMLEYARLLVQLVSKGLQEGKAQ